MSNLYSSLSAASFLAIGAAALLVSGQAGQISVRVLVVAAVVFSILSRNGSKDGGVRGFGVEATSLVSLVGGMVLAAIVFMAPPQASYRNGGIVASALVAIGALVLSKYLTKHPR